MTVLATESLSVHAADGSPLLTDISLAVEPGEMVVVCGRPGSGKTLLGKALRGLLNDRADLSVTGTVVCDDSIGFVLQSPRKQLVRRTVVRDVAFGLENQGIPADEIKARVDRCADRMDATRLLDRNISALSGGETTIVALLGVLVTAPDIVILDEPLSSLDYPNTTLVLSALDRLHNSGTTVILLEHDVRDLLRRCDRGILLEDGSITRSGSPRELLPDFYAAGVKLPFRTEVLLESDTHYDRDDLPLSPTDPVPELA